MSKGSPAGWYFDPQLRGYERWWDGERWWDEWRTVPAPGEAPHPREQPVNLGLDWSRLVAKLVFVISLLAVAGVAVADRHFYAEGYRPDWYNWLAIPALGGRFTAIVSGIFVARAFVDRWYD